MEELYPFVARGTSCEESAISERVNLMRASSLFAGLSPRECLPIAALGRMRTFARDEALFMQGHPVSHLILIQRGSVKMTQVSSTGSEVILWMATERDPVGLYAHIAQCQHSCSARALEPCSVVTWDYSRLYPFLDEHPRVRANINQILLTRLQELEERFREVATERVAKRLALTLLRLMKHVGRPHRTGTQVSLSREEIAQLVGTTLFTISRILSKWSETGLVLAQRQAVVITDAERLQILAQTD